MKEEKIDDEYCSNRKSENRIIMSSNDFLSRNCNEISQVAISEILKGWLFYIPSYQRGYRWTKTQIYDLCNDLLEYALKPNKDPRAFYSLQPLIVRKAKNWVNGEEKDTIEVIDGQQRLTSIYILYRFLMHRKKLNDEELKDDYKVSLYSIYYETRPNDFGIINKLGSEPIKQCEVTDIDIAHIVNAYNYIRLWLTNSKDNDPNCAEIIFNMYDEGEYKPANIVDKLFKLLNNPQNTKEPEGNIQFIWYEIDATKDAIQEFLSENKGKIKLTETEKIRALFMQRKSDFKVKDRVQLSIAKDWELIENTLHRNDFWSFISNDIHKEDGRITLIFKYIYDRDCQDKTYMGEDYLFRYYYQLFHNKHSDNAEDANNSDDITDNSVAIIEWDKKVMEAFRMLQNWYRNPRIYNLIGLLTKEQGISTKAIADIYDANDVITMEDFIKKLKQKVCEVIVDNIPISSGGNELLDLQGDYVNLFFNKPNDKKKIPGLLRFINVNLLCKEIEKLLEDVDKPDNEKKASDMGRSNRDEFCAIYRFPFEALDAFKWDVEHIDSATTNSLTDPKEQDIWIDESERALGSDLTDKKEYSDLKEALEIAETKEEKNRKKSEMLRIIRDLIGEDEIDERKNWIGNLTLLDCGTNRMYKNKIFALKRKIIHERINRGVFVPVCTQNVFNKIYQGCTKANLRWDINDKKAYHEFILKEIKQYKTKYSKEIKR